MAQEHPHAFESPPPPGETSATTSIEADVHGQMSLLAKRFQVLLNDISRTGLMRQMRIKRSGGVVMGAANVYSGPSTRATKVDIARPGMIVRVYAEETGQVFPQGSAWYRISNPFESPRYIAAGLVIRDNLHQSLQLYFHLAAQVWEATAADRLEELAHSDSYNTGVKELEQQLERFQELCDNGKKVQLPKRSRGQRRIRLYQRALEAWLDCLGESPGSMLSNLTTCGRTLYRTQGYLGLASCNGFDYVLIKSLQMLNVLVSLLSLLGLAWFIGQLPTDTSDSLAVKILASLIFLLTPAYLLWFSFKGISLPVMMGYALTRQRAPGAAQPRRKAHSRFVSSLQSLFHMCASIPRKCWNMSHLPLRWWLRVWGVLGGLSLLLTFLFLAILFSFDATGPFDLMGAAAITFSVYCIPICFIIILPFNITMQLQMWGELIAHPQRPPQARRSAVGPAVELLSFNTIFFLALAALIVNLAQAPFFIFLRSPVSPMFPSFITWQSFAYLLVVVVLFLLFLEIPYRWGLRTWKNRRLDELAVIRKEVNRSLRQALSAAEIEKELTFTHRDYVRWQYYRALEEEVKRTVPGPFSFEQRGWAILLTLATGFLINIATGPLSSLLSGIKLPH